METAIECQDLHRTYQFKTLLGKKQEMSALNGLNLSIPKGGVFSLLGPNGSGKTTTIKILSTLLTPTSGTARVFGFDVAKEYKKVRGRVGLILGGDRGVYGRLTGKENLNHFAALNHLSRKSARKRVTEVLEMVGLSDAADRNVEQYSRGMLQRLHIARGLLTDPELIFMDEPTIGLDPSGAMDLRKLVPELVRQGKTILLTTHYMLEADQLSSQVAIINQGKIIAAGSPSDIKRKFAKIVICEVICQQGAVEDIEWRVQSIKGVQRVDTSLDGPFQRLTVHALPGEDEELKGAIRSSLGEGNIESMVIRDPTLEEAYLNIIK